MWWRMLRTWLTCGRGARTRLRWAGTPRGNYLTADETRRLLDGESPIRIWREKRSLSQRALAEAAGIAAGYLAEIETGRKPGSTDALRRVAAALRVPLEDLLPHEPEKREPDYGPVLLMTFPQTAGVAESRRAIGPEIEQFATLADAKAVVHAQWSELRGQSPMIADATRFPILITEDLFREMEPAHFEQD